MTPPSSWPPAPRGSNRPPGPRRSSRPDAPHGTKQISKLLAILSLATAIAQIAPAIGIAELCRRCGVEYPEGWGAAFGVFGALMFVTRARSSMPDRRRMLLLVKFIDVPYFIHWCACFFCLIPGMIALIGALVFGLFRGTVVLPSTFLLGLYVTGLVVSIYGTLIRRRWVVVENHDIVINQLDPAFEGYRIAHLSDLHIGAMTPKEWGFRWARITNAGAPDMAVVTGDLATSGNAFHSDIGEVIGALVAPDGVFVSLGNHDYFGDAEGLVAAVRSRGSQVLRNEAVLVKRGGGAIHLSAIDDTWTAREDLSAALANRPPLTPSILLAHDPAMFPAAAALDVTLVLSGHTHGGQFAVPFLARYLSLSHFAHKFHLGFYRIANSTLYVHPGLGTTGPPMRLGVAPAIVFFTLRRG